MEEMLYSNRGKSPEITALEENFYKKIGGKSLTSTFGSRVHFIHIQQISENFKSNGTMPILKNKKIDLFIVSNTYLIKDNKTGYYRSSTPEESIDLFIDELTKLDFFKSY